MDKCATHVERGGSKTILQMFQWLHQKFVFPWFLLSPTVESRAASVVLTEVPGRGGGCHSSPCPDGIHCRTHTGEPYSQFSSLACNMYLIAATSTCCLALFHNHDVTQQGSLGNEHGACVLTDSQGIVA